jgi:hypothetical protein
LAAGRCRRRSAVDFRANWPTRLVTSNATGSLRSDFAQVAADAAHKIF